MRHKQLRRFGPLLVLLAIVLAIAPSTLSFAASTQTVTISATPSYLCIALSEIGNGGNDGNWAIGSVAENTDSYWWADEGEASVAPSFPLDPTSAESGGNISSACSSLAQDIDVKVNGAAFSGGVGWTVDSAAGEDTIVVRAGANGTASQAAMVVLTAGDQELINGMGADSWWTVEIALETGTFTDGVAKSGVVTFTASADT